jgi:hypothetical protein
MIAKELGQVVADEFTIASLAARDRRQSGGSA